MACCYFLFLHTIKKLMVKNTYWNSIILFSFTLNEKYLQLILLRVLKNN
jgi:hypothetical protein